MEAVGLGLAVLAEVQTTVKSLQDRISCFKEEETLVAEADIALARLKDLFDTITAVLAAKPKSIPHEFVSSFKGTLENVQVSLHSADLMLGKIFSQVSPKKTCKSNGVARTGMKKMKQFAKAKSIVKGLPDILGTANRAEGTLQLLLTQICNPVKCDEIEDNISSKIEKNRFPVENFRRAFNAPALLPKIRLNFDSEDELGRFSTPEGKLRNSVFVSTSTKNVTVARGAQSAVHGVSGMADVGKTIALVGLGHDPEICEYFADGVLYMSLGAAATVEHATAELSKIMRLTGAISRAFDVD